MKQRMWHFFISLIVLKMMGRTPYGYISKILVKSNENGFGGFLRRLGILATLILLLTGITLSFQACSDSDDSPAPKKSNNGGTRLAPTNFEITFERIKNSLNGQSFKVLVTGENILPEDIENLSLSKGSISSWSQKSDNKIEATITPDADEPTGRYGLRVETIDGQVFSRTPIVLQHINNKWNQPEIFGGNINTSGWEDSPYVFVVPQPDGSEKLFLTMVYIVVHFDCVQGAGGGDPDHPNCAKVAGPYQAPERPHMTIQSYVSADGSIDHTLPSLVAPGAKGAAKIGATLFVFEFNQDGHQGFLGTPKASPQALIIENDDGYSVNSGPFIYKNGSKWQLMYHNDQFIDYSGFTCPGYPVDTGLDIYIYDDWDPSQSKIVLGSYDRVDPGEFFSDATENTGTTPCPELLLNNHLDHNFPLMGIQDNPMVYFGGSQPVVTWDLEGGGVGFLEMISMSAGSFPSGTWDPVAGLSLLDAPPVEPGPFQPEKTQPVLTDDQYCYRLETDVYCIDYNGGNPTLNSSYGLPELQLEGVGFGGSPYVGQITGTGEPTPFTYAGENCLSFAIAEETEISGNLDLGVAWVCE